MPKATKYTVLRNWMLFVGLLAFFSLVVRPGLSMPKSWDFFWHIVDGIIVASFVVNFILRFIWAPDKKIFIRSNAFELAILFIFSMQLFIMILFLRQPQVSEAIRSIGTVSITKIYVLFAQIFIAVELIANLGRINARVASLPLSPPVLFVGSFVFVIAVGTLLLSLPGATKHGIKFIDALFTATSATCVTGLIVMRTGADFTRYGHNVILGLIQIGGLGLMTFATFSALILRGEIGIKERVLLGDILNIRVFSKIKSLVIAIILFTLVIEALGAVGLYFATGEYESLPEGRLYFSVFHAVSAFCNAGFSLWDTNLARFVHNPLGSIIMMILIVLGGLGFVVLTDLWTLLTSPFRRRRNVGLSLHSKLVLILTLSLILSATIVFFLLERGHILSGLSTTEKWIAAFFQAITPRTAGFNTVSTGALRYPTLFLLGILMFIGASPGSTGGGIKTTTFGIIILGIINRLRGHEEIKVFNRTIPWYVMQQAAMVMFLGLTVVSLGLFGLLILEPDKGFINLLFEQLSAFGTVGLSTGITPNLSTGAKLIIIVTMLIGRIGPLTFLTAIAFRMRKSRVGFPKEDILIG